MVKIYSCHCSIHLRMQTSTVGFNLLWIENNNKS